MKRTIEMILMTLLIVLAAVFVGSALMSCSSSDDEEPEQGGTPSENPQAYTDYSYLIPNTQAPYRLLVIPNDEEGKAIIRQIAEDKEIIVESPEPYIDKSYQLEGYWITSKKYIENPHLYVSVNYMIEEMESRGYVVHVVPVITIKMKEGYDINSIKDKYNLTYVRTTGNDMWYDYRCYVNNAQQVMKLANEIQNEEGVEWTVISRLGEGLIGKNDPDDSSLPEQDLPTTLDLTRAEQEMVSSSNDFAFNLFREARDEVKSQILSPISITYALGMLNNGAAGETQEQINKVLGFTETGAAGINDFCYKMLQRASTLDEKTKVLIANTIYVNTDWGLNLYPAFVSTAKAYYNAEPEGRSFTDGKTRDVINQWASDHTEGMIKEILKEDDFKPDFVSYLLNAIYFKGTWAKKFDKNMTQEEKFEHPGFTLEVTSCPMMHQMEDFEYTETETFQAIRLPYGNGAYQMTILLPIIVKDSEVQTGEDINKVLTSLTAESWQQIQQQMSPTTVDLKLPRFESDTNINLKPIMQKLGMIRAFNDDLAQFPAQFPYFCPPLQTWIGIMKQVAKIKLDEEGTEAAAVTVDGVDGKDAYEPQYVTFHANHPFLYVISEKATGAIFFIGQYTGY